MKKLLVLLTVMIFAVAAFGQNASEKITEERKLDTFNKIDASGIARVEIIVGAPQQVTVIGEADIVPQVSTEVSGGTLHIGFKSEKRKIKFKDNCCDFTVKICVEDLTQLITSGAVMAEIHQKAVLKNFKIIASGATNIKIEDLSVEGSLSASASGASQMEINGENFGDVNIMLSGASMAKFTGVANYLDLHASGASNITISGQADEVYAQASGASNIRSKKFTANKKSFSSSGASSIYLVE